MLDSMIKHALIFCLAVIGFPLQAQNVPSQQAVALLQQESEERYRNLKAALEDLQAAHIALLQRMDALEKENRELRSKVAILPKTAVSDSDLQQVSDALLERIRSVDQKRADDNKVLVQQIKDLVKQMGKTPRASSGNTPPQAPSKPRRVPKEIAEITVEPGYTISAIAEAYRQEGYSITTQDILEANPQISDPRRIKVGDVVIIPIKW
jgi:hypothetical protein